MGGLIKTMPVTAVAFLLCAFSVMGIPPFGGFFSKFMVISGTVKAGHVGSRRGLLPARPDDPLPVPRCSAWSSWAKPKRPAPRKDPVMVFVVGLARRPVAGGRASSSPTRRRSSRARDEPDPGDAPMTPPNRFYGPFSCPPSRPCSRSSSPPASKRIREGISLPRRPRSLNSRRSPCSRQGPRVPPPLGGTGGQFRPAPVPFLGLHPPRPRRVPVPDHALFDGQDEGRTPGSGSSTPTSSSRPPWPTARCSPTTSSSCSSSGKACWSRCSA